MRPRATLVISMYSETASVSSEGLGAELDPPGAEDLDWIPPVGKNGWLIITRDSAMGESHGGDLSSRPLRPEDDENDSDGESEGE